MFLLHTRVYIQHLQQTIIVSSTRKCNYFHQTMLCQKYVWSIHYYMIIPFTKYTPQACLCKFHTCSCGLGILKLLQKPWSHPMLTNYFCIFALCISKIQFNIDLHVEIYTYVLSNRLFSKEVLYNSVHTCYKPRPSYYPNVIVTTYLEYYTALTSTDFLFLLYVLM